MIRIGTFNLNGFRSAERRGFWSWFARNELDVLCVQETRGPLDLPKSIRDWEFVERPNRFSGSAGVGMFIRPPFLPYNQPLVAVQKGRLMSIKVQGVSIHSLYAPSPYMGTHDKERIHFLEQIYQASEVWIQEPCILCGDFNVVSSMKDIHPSLLPQRRSFIHKEIAWMQRMKDLGWVDVWREMNPSVIAYSYWSHRHPQLRTENRGLRLDYQMVSPHLAKHMIATDMVGPELMISDHAPVVVDYDLPL